MKKLLIFILLPVFVTCRDGRSSLGLDAPRDTACMESCVEEAFDYYLQSVDQYNPCMAEPVCYFVRFAIWGGRDTMVLVSRHRNGASVEGYKGCAAIRGYKILVFDEDNLGGDFYNIDFLEKEYPCDSGTCSRGSGDERMEGLGMIVRDSVFDFLGSIPPDDWKPIPIHRKTER